MSLIPNITPRAQVRCAAIARQLAAGEIGSRAAFDLTDAELARVKPCSTRTQRQITEAGREAHSRLWQIMRTRYPELTR